MKKINDVLIELQDVDVEFENPVKVFLNHDHDKPLGVCYIHKYETGLTADFVLDNPPEGVLHPSIGYRTDSEEGHKIKRLYEVSLSTNPNVDPAIKGINFDSEEKMKADEELRSQIREVLQWMSDEYWEGSDCQMPEESKSDKLLNAKMEADAVDKLFIIAREA